MGISPDAIAIVLAGLGALWLLIMLIVMIIKGI